jgi:diketogulonate reductase-like aldo/keto reductase
VAVQVKSKVKTVISALVCAIIIMGGAVAASAADDTAISLRIGEPTISVNGVEGPIDENGTVPVIQDGRTLLPVRAVVEAMGGNVEWDDATRTVTLTQGGIVIEMVIGSATLRLNGAPQTMDVAPAIISSRTMLPIRFIAEGFGYAVSWDGATRTVTITESGVAESTFDLERGRATLNNGIEMPILGLGTYRLTEEETEESVYHALTSGYRLIDTAAAYGNEEAVGRGIKRSDVPREDIFITTKLWPDSYADAANAIDAALEKLDVEYIDLLLLHQPWGDFTEAYQAMEIAVGEGKVRAIGLSNVYQNNFDAIMDVASIPPAVLQNERHPYFQQADMMGHIEPYGTIMMDWFPLGGRGDNTQPSELQRSLFEDEVIVEIAEAHEKTEAQVILRWHIQSGGIAIPGSRNPDHILENITIFDFELTEDEMRKIAALETGIPAFDFRDEAARPNFAPSTPPSDSGDQE